MIVFVHISIVCAERQAHSWKVFQHAFWMTLVSEINRFKLSNSSDARAKVKKLKGRLLRRSIF
jgi:hypothetical protein